MNFAWEQLGDGVHRCRLPFLDVTVGLVRGRTATLLIDTGTTLTEADAIMADVDEIAGSAVSHIVLTHNHFDHILGSSAFVGTAVYCAPEVAATIAHRTEHLRDDAVRYGAEPDEVARAIAALGTPEDLVRHAEVDLGEESADPAIDQDSDPLAWPATLTRVLDVGGPDAVFVAGHGACVDATFVERQRRWLVNQV